MRELGFVSVQSSSRSRPSRRERPYPANCGPVHLDSLLAWAPMTIAHAMNLGNPYESMMYDGMRFGARARAVGPCKGYVMGCFGAR